MISKNDLFLLHFKANKQKKENNDMVSQKVRLGSSTSPSSAQTDDVDVGTGKGFQRVNNPNATANLVVQRNTAHEKRTKTRCA